MHRSWYDRKVRRVRDFSSGGTRVYLALEVRRVHCRRCQAVKRERLEFLADNPLYTERFAWYVGRRCRASSIKDIAEELNLHWHTVKDLEKQYLREQLRRASQLAGSDHGLKYSLFYGREGERLVCYDNERGKGDHRHLKSREERYTFTSVEKLIEDFKADVRRVRGES